MVVKIKRHWETIALILILMIAAFLTCYKIWDEGTANAYYTAAVKSMLTSWHNFFFASLDPGGFISVDKPAPGLWLQCLFALVLGVNGWSVILPEALCSVASVAITYRLVKRSFGKPAGLLAAFFLSLTPIFIAASRSNNLDAAMVTVCLLALWAVVKAAEKGSLKLLILSAALIGIGFNIKMMQAYMFLPAVYLVYFFSAKTKYRKRILHLVLATVVLVTISLSWAVAVDLTPASDRPYVGSSATNSELELALGYNGLVRLLPSSSGMNGMRGQTASDSVSSVLLSNTGVPNEGGNPGFLRLFNQEMAGQASWLLVLSIIGLLVLILLLCLKRTNDKKLILRQLLLWGGVFIPMFAFFSISGHFHRYYMIMFAPCQAALSAIAVTELWRFYKQSETGVAKLLNFMLPLAILLEAAAEYVILSYYPGLSPVFTPIIVIGAVVSVIALILLKLLSKVKGLALLAASIGILALLAAPAYWSLSSINSTNVSIPVAAPTGSGSNQGGPGGGGAMFGAGSKDGQFGNMPPMDSGNDGRVAGPPDDGGSFNSQRRGDGGGNADGGMQNGSQGEAISDSIVNYMLSNYHGERYLVAVSNASAAESIIIQHGVGVMAMGGFSGNDKAITLDEFKTLVQQGQIDYYWAGRNSNSDITNWVEQNGHQVTTAEISGVSSDSSDASSATSLYDLTGLRTT